jgi:hypothetical protein
MEPPGGQTSYEPHVPHGVVAGQKTRKKSATMAEDCKSGSDGVGRNLGLSPGEGYGPEQCSIRESVGYEDPQKAPELLEIH